MFRLLVSAEFAAAHHLPSHMGKCSEVHGHTYKVEVFILAHGCGSDGMVVDFGDIRGGLDILTEVVDHHDLNELSMFRGLEPTAENMSAVFYHFLKNIYTNILPQGAWLEKVRVYEHVGKAWAEYYEGS